MHATILFGLLVISAHAASYTTLSTTETHLHSDGVHTVQHKQYVDSFPTRPAVYSTDGAVLWQQNQPDAIYSSAKVDVEGDFATATTVQDAPFELEGFKLSGEGKPIWTKETKAPEWNHGVQWSAVLAAKASGKVNTFAAQFDGAGNFSMTIYGLEGKTGEVAWKLPLTKVSTDLLDLSLLSVCPCGKYLAVAMYANVSMGSPGFTQVQVLDAQTGKLVFTYDVHGTAGKTASPTAVYFTPDHKYLILGVSTELHVIDMATQKIRGKPIVLQFVSAPHALAISPDGEYVSCGFLQLLVFKWDKTANEYTQLWSHELTDRSFVNSMAFDDKGHLVVGWVRLDFMSTTIAVHDTTKEDPLWSYVGPSSVGNAQRLPAQIVVDGDFFALAEWGDQNNTTPQIQVFKMIGKTPVFEYTTPGSMFSIDLEVDEKGVPFVTAGGKHVHANVMGKGGDVFAIKVPVGKKPASVDVTW